MDGQRQPPTDRAQAQAPDVAPAAYRASEERFRLISDFTHDWEQWEGPDGRFLYMSPSCFRITGYQAGEFLQDPGLLRRLVHPDDRVRFEEHYHQERSSPGAHSLDFRIVTRDGQERWIGHVCQRVYGDDGTWLGWRGSNRDITAQKRAEEEGARQTRGLQTLLYASERMMAQMRLDGLLHEVVLGARDLTGARTAIVGHGQHEGRFANIATSGDEACLPMRPARILSPPWSGIYLDLVEERPCRRLRGSDLQEHLPMWEQGQDCESLRDLLVTRLVGSDGSLNGVLLVFDEGDGAFHDEDEALLAQFAALASLALQHIEARLGLESEAEARVQAYEELEVAGKELHQQNEELLEARRELQAALEEAEEGRRTLEALMEYVPEGITLASAPDIKITRTSRFAQESLGRSHAGQRVDQIVERWMVYEPDGVTPMAEEDLPLVRAIHNCEVVEDLEIVQLNARGERLWLSCNAGPILDSAGEVAGGVVAWRDVTEQKRAEQALRDSEARYRHLFDGMTEGFALHEIICDAEGQPCNYRFLEINAAFERLTGLDRDDLLGKMVLEVLPGTEPFWIETYGRVALTGEPIHFEQYSSVLDRHYAVSAYRPAENQFACLFLDITERIKAKQRIEELAARARRQAEELNTVFDAIVDGVLVYDAAGRPMRANPAVVAAYGVDPVGGDRAELARRLAVRHPDGRPVSVDEDVSSRALRGERVAAQPFVFSNTEGEEISIVASGAPLFDRGEVSGAVVVWHDATERKRAEEALRRSSQFPEENPNPVLRVASDGVLLYANAPARKWLATLGWQVGGQLPAHVGAVVADARGQGQAIEGEISNPAGATFWLSAVQPPGEEYINLYGRDITERKQIEGERERLLEENRRQREFLERLIESAPLGIAVISGPDHRYELANPYYRAIPGLPDVQVIGHTLAEIFPQVAAQGALAFIEEVYQTGEGVGIREYEATVGPEREGTYWNVDHVPLFDVDGKVERVLILAQEVSEQVLARQRIEELAGRARRRAEELDAVFEALIDAVVVYDGEGRLLKANRAALDFMKVSESEVMGHRLANNVQRFGTRHPDGRPVLAERLPAIRALDGETVKDQRLVFNDATGEAQSFLVSAAPLYADGQVVGSVATWHDVTEVEEAQRERERLIAILEATPDMVSTARPDGQVLYFNRAARRILGIAEDVDLAGLEILQGYPDWANRVVQNEGIPTAVREGIWQGRTAVLDREGREIPMSQIILAHRAPDGQVEYLSTVARDVSREQEILAQAQEAQQRAEEQAAMLDAMLDSIADSVAFYGLDARIVRANEPAQRLFGEMPDVGIRALAERVAENRATREDGTRFALEELPVMRALRGETVTGMMMAMYSHSGAMTWHSVSAAPVRTPAAGLLGAIVSFTDVTELRQARDELEARVRERTADLVGINEVLQSEIAMRRQAEAELRESELRFRQLAENVDEMFWLIEPQHDRLLYVNPAFEALWGLPLDEAYRSPRAVLERVHPNDRERLMSVLLGSDVANDEEFRIAGPDGTVRWLRGRAFAVETQQSPEPRLAGIVSDITAQKEAQTALIQAERMTTAGRLAASLAHEINNPLQAAMGCLELASEAVEGGRNPSRFLEVISEALGRASRVVVQLRTLQRRSRTEERLPVELWLLLDQVVVLTQKKCQSQGVEVVCEIDEELPELNLMPDAIQQVLLNLVLNAVDAMPEGGQLRIEAKHNHRPPGVWIRFTDTGAGLLPEVREHLFEPFHSTKSGGLGLGLFISQNIVQQHGGRIEAESEEGQGTVFSIWLPVQE